MRISVLLTAVLFAASAHAEWQAASVPGTPRDVQVWAPGTYSVATTNGAWFYLVGGGTMSVAGSMQGTYLSPQGCAVALASNGDFLLANPSVTCPAPTSSVFPAPDFQQVFRMRHDGAGVGYVSAVQNPDTAQLFYSQSGATATEDWMPLIPGGFSPGVALGALQLGTDSYALYGANNQVVLVGFKNPWADATASTYTGPPAYAPNGGIKALDLFDAGKGTPSAIFGTVLGLYRLELGSGAFSQVQMSVPPAQANGVDVNTGTGSARADGFGMAVLQTANGPVVLSAMPSDVLAKVGDVWQPNTSFPTNIPTYASAPLSQVACAGAEFCVFTVNQSGGNNLLIYRNTNAPQLSAPASLTIPEGTSGAPFVPVTDADGDALFVSAQGVNEGPLSLSASPTATGVQLTYSAASVCENYTATGTVALFASDGMASHERTATIPVTVTHTVPPATPVIASEFIVPAGTGPTTFNASVGSGCTPQHYTWTPLTGSPTLQESGGATATFSPPEYVCEPHRYNYRVQGSDSAGVSQPADFAVVLQPYGVPLAPFAPGAARSVVAGERVELEPEALHPCAATAGPSIVKTVWRLSAGQSLPAGVRVLDDKGQEVDDSKLPVEGSHLTVATDDCTDVSVSFSAYNQTVDSAELRGPEATVRVDVKTQLLPFSAGRLVLKQDAATEVAGTVAVEGLNCLARRNLRAELRFSQPDGTPLAPPVRVGVGERWHLLDVGTCGGSYLVSGQLIDESTGALGSTASLTLKTPGRVDVALGPLESPTLVAACGEGARGTLVQTIPQGACQAVQVHWEQLSGPALASTTFSGTRLDVATKETGLDALVGQHVRLRVSADGGGGNAASREQDVAITAAPFVEVRHETEKPSGSESGLQGMAVQLRNTTACSVSGVVLEERLEGMSFVPGSARLDGAPVDVEAEGGLLRVQGLALQGLESHRFTYVARPELLGTPRQQAQVLLRDVPVSARLQEVPPAAGCGCTSGGSGAGALGLLALGARLTRRRGTRGRS